MGMIWSNTTHLVLQWQIWHNLQPDLRGQIFELNFVVVVNIIIQVVEFFPIVPYDLHMQLHTLQHKTTSTFVQILLITSGICKPVGKSVSHQICGWIPTGRRDIVKCPLFSPVSSMLSTGGTGTSITRGREQTDMWVMFDNIVQFSKMKLTRTDL